MTTTRKTGFTLIEVLVAFAIAAISLATLFRIFAGGLESARLSEAEARATMLAESYLAAVGVEAPLDDEERAGETEDGYRWRVTARDLDLGDGTKPARRYEVTVAVAWGPEDERERAVVLRTVRLGPKR